MPLPSRWAALRHWRRAGGARSRRPPVPSIFARRVAHLADDRLGFTSGCSTRRRRDGTGYDFHLVDGRYLARYEPALATALVEARIMRPTACCQSGRYACDQRP